MASSARWQQATKHGVRWTEDDATQALAAWRASGRTVVAFSREHGLGQRLERWDRKLRGREQESGGDASVPLAPLIPVRVHGSPSSSSSVSIVVTDEELRIEISDPSTAPAKWLGDLVLALRGEQR